MNKKLISLMAAALTLLSASGQLTFTGVGKYPVIEVTPDLAMTGLHKIYVVYDTDGVGMTYTSSSGERATVTSYDAHNWGNPDTVPTMWNGGWSIMPTISWSSTICPMAVRRLAT